MPKDPTPPPASPDTPAIGQPPATQPKRRLRRFLGILGVLIVLLVATVLALPWLLGSAGGTRLLLAQINRSIPGHVQVGTLSLSWWRPLQIEQLQIFTADGQQAASIAHVQLSEPRLGRLLTLLWTRQIALHLDASDGEIHPDRLQIALSHGANSSADPDQPLIIPGQFTLNTRLSHFRVVWEPPATQPVVVQIDSAEVQLNAAANLHASLSASVRHAEHEGQFTLDAQVGDLVNAQGHVQLELATMDIQLKLANVPTALLDALATAPQPGLYPALLGPLMDGDITIKGRLDAVVADITLKAEHLQATGAFGREGSTLTVIRSPEAVWTLQPAALALLDNRLILAAPVTTRLTLDRFDPSDPDPAHWLVDMALIVDPIDLTMADHGHLLTERWQTRASTQGLGQGLEINTHLGLAINEAKGQLTATARLDGLIHENGHLDPTSARLALKLALQDSQIALLLDGLLGTQDLFQLAWPGVANLTLDGNMALRNMRVHAGEMTLRLPGPTVQADVAVVITPEQMRVQPDTTLHYQLTPQLIARLLNNGQETALLRSPAALSLAIEQLVIPRHEHGLNLRAVQLQAVVSSPRIQPGLGDATLDRLTLEAAHMTLEHAPGDADWTAALTGNLLMDDQPAADTQANFTLRQSDDNPWALNLADLQFTKVQTALLQALAGEALDLQPALGGTVQRIALRLAPVDSEPGHYHFTVQGTDPDVQLDARLSGHYRQHETMRELILDQPGQATLVLDAQAIDAYLAPTQEHVASVDRWLSEGPATVTIAINRFAWRQTLSDSPATPPRLDLDLVLNTGRITMKHVRDGMVQVEDFELKLLSPPQTPDLTMTLAGSISQQTRPDVPATRAAIASRTQVQDLFSDQLTLETDTSIPSLPVVMLDRLVSEKENLVVIFGPVADVSVKGHYPGNLAMDITSANFHTALRVAVDRDHVATLAQDFVSTLSITPEMATAFLGSFHPVLADAIGSQKPIVLTIHPVDPTSDRPLRVNLKEPIDFKTMDISGRLELGIIEMKRHGWLKQTIVSGMREIGKFLSLGLRLPDSGQGPSYLAHFTPMDFTMLQGELETSQLWLYTDDMVIGYQGKVDFNRENYDMAMGVTGVSFLAGGPAIFSQIIDPSNIYDIPISGRMGENPNVDWSVMGVYLAGSVGRVQLDNTIGRFGGLGQLGVNILSVGGNIVQEGMRQSRGIAWDMPTEVKKQVHAITEHLRGRATPQESEPTEQPTPDVDSDDATPTEDPPQPAQPAAAEQPRNHTDDVRNILGGLLRPRGDTPASENGK